MIIDTWKSPYSIKCDGKTDNAAGLEKIRKALTGGATEKHIINFREGVMLSSFNRWLFGVSSFKVVGNNTTFETLYAGSDEAQKRAIFVGEMMQNNVLEYKGTKMYVLPDEIEPAKAGDRFITLKEPGDYEIGDLIHINSFDLFSGGYPRAAKYFDWLEIIDVRGYNLLLKMPLKENFSEIGNPIIFKLENYCRHAEFEGITMKGNFAFPALKLIMTDCNIRGWLWPNECREIIYNNVYADNVEVDKIVDRITFNGLKTPSSPSNGGSVNRIEMNDCQTDSIRLCPRELILTRPVITANKTLQNEQEQRYDNFIAAVADAPARCPVRRLTINQATFISGPDSKADTNIECAPIEQLVIETDGNDIIIPTLQQLATIDKGLTIINNSRGTNGGRVTEIKAFGDKWKVSGTWDKPVSGEKWLWSHVHNLIDNGGHRSFNDKPVFGPQSKRWQGNTSTGEIKTMILTEKDFTGKNPRIWVNGWIIKTSSFIQEYSPAIEIKIVDSDDQSIYKNISDSYPVWCKELDLIGSGGKFTIVIEWKSY
jgi:hypothetical protein